MSKQLFSKASQLAQSSFRRLIPILGVMATLTAGGGVMSVVAGGNDPMSVVRMVMDKLPVLSTLSSSQLGGTGSAGVEAVSPQAAKAALDRLQVAPKMSMQGYTRDKFGQAWTDNNGAQWGHNGCSTRDDILKRDLTDTRSKGCRVESGVLHDPYTGKTIKFQRGPNTSATVQIDHVVPLGNAWRTGAQKLSMALRTNLANDPLNLLAVDGPTNQAKSDKDASEWLPPRSGFHCAYVTRQIQVKTRYHLWVTMGEKAAMRKVLDKCSA